LDEELVKVDAHCFRLLVLAAPAPALGGRLRVIRDQSGKS